MKPVLGISPLLGGALVAAIAQPGLAVTATITGVRVNPTPGGVEIVLDTQDGEAANIFTINQGNTLRADITRTQLALADAGQYQQLDPAPGIASLTIAPLDANSVRLTVEGSSQAPTGTIESSSPDSLVLAVRTTGDPIAAEPSNVPDAIVTVPGEAATPNQSEAPASVGSLAQAPPNGDGAAPPPAMTQPDTDLLIPNPGVTIDGVSIPAPQTRNVPPFLPRAVAPPIGDIAVAEGNPAFPDIDLGSNERIPKLLLRDAPSREVLSLLARAADSNLVFTDPQGDGEGPRITLDIENESVQDVFNHVLRVSGLQANRVGRSIYVGPRLPLSAQNVVLRTLRLNQVDATVAANFLVALGAESAVSRERLVTNVNAVEVAEGVPPITQTETAEVDQIETQRVDYEDAEALLRGLQVIADERTNSVTLSGQPHLVSIATEQLARIDVRRRQVAINVRVIDVDLNALDAFGTSFSFSVGDFDFVQSGGVGVINFGAGNLAPATTEGGIPSVTPLGPREPSINPFTIANDFLLQLTAVVQNGNAKILTDPTLIVQEGQTATISLTEDVVTEIDITTETVDDQLITRTEFTVEPAGLVLQVDVDRIDDNGFVSLSVAPSISAPSGQTFPTGAGEFTLLSDRSLSSGQVRVRDGQTLLLSGIIQESERVSVTKVPILGDIPILGALFRSSTRDNDRQELIVLLTPEILDDSDQSVFGYSYTPSEEVRELLDQHGN